MFPLGHWEITDKKRNFFFFLRQVEPFFVQQIWKTLSQT